MSSTSVPIPSPPPSRRAERSCVLCHRRKVRCDRKTPCSPCTRGSYSCTYPQVGRPVKRARKTTIIDIASRIQDLERTLVSVSQERSPSNPPRPASEPEPDSSSSRPVRTVHRPPPENDEILLRQGTSSRYFDEVLISRVIGQERDIQSALTSPGGLPSQPAAATAFNPMGILSAPCVSRPISSYLPPKKVAQRLWNIFLDKVDPIQKIVHIPTAELITYTVIDNPDQATPEGLALCYSIYYAATVSLDAFSCGTPSGLTEAQISDLLLFKTGLEQCFAHGDLLESPTVTMLHALAVYMSALRVHNPGRAIWTLNGLAIRAAQSIGLHRDGRRLGLSPFDAEIRRRLWWYFIQRDGRAAEDYGLQSPANPHLTSGVDLPRNLEDSDLYPELEELPPARKGWTAMTSLLANIVTAEAWNRLAQLGWYSPRTPEEVTRTRIISELRSRLKGFLDGCNPVIPVQRLGLNMVWFVFRKLDLITRQQWLAISHPQDREAFATEEHLVEALKVLDTAWAMYTDDLLSPFHWTMRAYPQYHVLLYVLWHLCVRPQTPAADRAWRAIDLFFSDNSVARIGLGGPGPKWPVLLAMKAKATAIRRQVQVDEVFEGEHHASMPTPAATEVRSDEGAGGMMQGGPRVDSMEWASALRAMTEMPDWSTLMQDFQLDEHDFTII